MSIEPYRLLGFAFASADLLFELNQDGRIAFAVGAAQVLSGEAERTLVGRSWREFVKDEDQALVEALLEATEAGRRRGPATVRLARPKPRGPDAFSVSVCKLPQNGGAVSCAASAASAPTAGSGEGGLHERDGFEDIAKGLFQTAKAAGQELDLALVELRGLETATQRLPKSDQAALRRRLAGVLRAQSHAGSAAAKLAEERYALVKVAGESADALAGRISRLLSDDLNDVRLTAQIMDFDGDVSGSQMVRTMRYVLDDFIREGAKGDQPAKLKEALDQTVRRTLQRAGALSAALADRRFTLAYQPVVSVADGRLHHHEALVRFGDDSSPFPMIRMAEELDLIEGLDVAVVERGLAELSTNATLALAVNVSGRSIMSRGFVDNLKALLAACPGVEGRLLFEITESAAMEDLGLANRRIQILRNLGCAVCLDDFGAGAASLAYLQQLHLDIVKIDGRYVRELQHGGRASTFIKHLGQMCAELKVKTLAEMVETPAAEEAVRKAGIDFAQGYHYGAPAACPEQPIARRPTTTVAARRVGAVESWG